MTAPTPAPSATLNDGHELPVIALGTWPLSNDEVHEAVTSAVADGYRHIDTAMRYHNEIGVGRALARAREQGVRVGVTSKLRGGDQGAANVRRAFEATRTALGVQSVDLYLIHWPLPRLGLALESWREMIALRDEGKITSIGVSNFREEDIRELIEETGVVPAVNQVELHPTWRQDELRAVCAELGIAVQAWGPLGRGKGLLERPEVREIAAAHGVTAGQAVLRWHYQHGVLTAPKSSSAQRRRENLDIFGFELTDAQMAALDSLPQEYLGADPATHEEF